MKILDRQDAKRTKQANITEDMLRENLVDLAKKFKLSWVQLGQTLYPVWKDKLFYTWGYDKFEYYVQRELGIKKTTALKLLKTYFFLEQEEPAYLKEDYVMNQDAGKVPDYDTINVLRLARSKKELDKHDYGQLRKSVFEKGRNDTLLRKDLTQLMKQRKEVDPEEERDKRNRDSIRKLVTAIKSFKKDMETLKLSSPGLVTEAESFMERLEKELA